MSMSSEDLKKLIANNRKKKNYNEGLEPVEDDDNIIDNTSKFDALDVATKMMYPAILTDQVLMGFALSVMIFGSAGIGKTYGVMKALEESGRTWILTEDEERTMSPEQMDELVDKPKPSLVKISGAITQKGLYKVLYKFRKGFILVFDDCDDVLKDKKMANLLKAVLDNGIEHRIVTWESSVKNEELPTSFEFHSQIIFISNMTADRVDKAVRSRSVDINLVLNPDEAYEHIGNVLPFIVTTRLNENGEQVKIDLDQKIQKDIFEKISVHRTRLAEYSFRTFKNAVSCYQFCNESENTYGKDWFDLWYEQQDEILQ